MQPYCDYIPNLRYKGVDDVVLLVRPTDTQTEYEIRKKMTKTWKSEDSFVKIKNIKYIDLTVHEWCTPTNLRFFTSSPFVLPVAPMSYCKSRLLIKTHYHATDQKYRRIEIFNGHTADKNKHINFAWKDFIIFYEGGNTFIFHNEKPLIDKICADCGAFNVINKYPCLCNGFSSDIKKYWENQELPESKMREHCELISETTLPYMEWGSFIKIEDTCYARQRSATEKVTQKILSLYPNIKDIVFVSGFLRFT